MARVRKSFSDYRDAQLRADPYLAALYEATKDVPLDQLDSILEAFPYREEWERNDAEAHREDTRRILFDPAYRLD